MNISEVAACDFITIPAYEFFLSGVMTNASPIYSRLLIQSLGRENYETKLSYKRKFQKAVS